MKIRRNTEGVTRLTSTWITVFLAKCGHFCKDGTTRCCRCDHIPHPCQLCES